MTDTTCIALSARPSESFRAQVSHLICSLQQAAYLCMVLLVLVQAARAAVVGHKATHARHHVRDALQAHTNTHNEIGKLRSEGLMVSVSGSSPLSRVAQQRASFCHSSCMLHVSLLLNTCAPSQSPATARKPWSSGSEGGEA